MKTVLPKKKRRKNQFYTNIRFSRGSWGQLPYHHAMITYFENMGYGKSLRRFIIVILRFSRGSWGQLPYPGLK